MDLTSDLCPSTTLTPPTHTAPSLHLYFSLSNLRTREETKRFIIIILCHPTHTTHHRPSTSDHLPQTPIIDHPLKTIYPPITHPQPPSPYKTIPTDHVPPITQTKISDQTPDHAPQTTHPKLPVQTSQTRPPIPGHPFLSTHPKPPPQTTTKGHPAHTTYNRPPTTDPHHRPPNTDHQPVSKSRASIVGSCHGVGLSVDQSEVRVIDGR